MFVLFRLYCDFFFFFFQVNGDFALDWFVWKFWACGFYRFWVWFYMLWFLLYHLKKCGFENLNNPLFEKPKTDRTGLKPKYTETDWFPTISVVSVENFTNRNIQFQLAIPIQTNQNWIEHTPRLCPSIKVVLCKTKSMNTIFCDTTLM